MENNNELLQTVIEKAEKWLSNLYDDETVREVKSMLDNPDKTALIEAFYKDLEFGTGGLRGIMGAGSNRMNIYTVGAATQGLANYLIKQFGTDTQIKVVIGYDCRNNSKKFSRVAADIFSGNGIYVYLFEDLRPTPEVSFAIRHFGCKSGIMITASHNPKDYNGYKAYWDDGAQVVAPHDKNIIKEVEQIKSVEDIKFKGNPDLIQIIGEEVDDLFIEKIKSLSLSSDSVKRYADMKIVYTPLHGTGKMLVPKALKAYGFKNIIHVPEQDVISGDFPTVQSPNPEESAALRMAIEKAKETGAEIVLATDPDADRIGTAVRNDNGDYVLVNGNQTMVLLIYYILTRYDELGKFAGNEYIVKTIVSTELLTKIAEKFNVKIFDCYTGFKWIAAVIREHEGKLKYIGGGEESYGFLAEDFVRDKDSVSACALFAELAAWSKDQGKSVLQLLKDIYIEFGYSKEKGVSIVRKGKSGAEEIQNMMKTFRENPPSELGGMKVSEILDFQTLKKKNLIDNSITKLEMPEPSNVLQYILTDGSKISIRPSGTEPKIKFYFEIKGELTNRDEYDNAENKASEKISLIQKELNI